MHLNLLVQFDLALLTLAADAPHGEKDVENDHDDADQDQVMMSISWIGEVADVAESHLDVEVGPAHLRLCLDRVCLTDGAENFVCVQISMVLVPIDGQGGVHLDANADLVLPVITQ